MSQAKKALIVIDLQNDYFAGGAFPLWNPEAVLERTEAAIRQAQRAGVPVVLVQHVADARKGRSPFFNAGTEGVALHPRLLAAAPQAPVVVKAFADSFHQTTLDDTLQALGVEELLLCGMMTQNCVTHTALSRDADRYAVKVLPDLCTTVTEMLHLIALSGMATRVAMVPSEEALAAA